MIYDISQTLHAGMPVWPGDQKFRVRWSMRKDKGDSCNVSAVTMSVHTGTHVDAPFHFEDSGPDAAAISLEPFVGAARVVEIGAAASVGIADLDSLAAGGVKRVLLKTRAVAEEVFRRDYPHLSEEAAGYLGRLGVVLVGTDAPSIDAFGSKSLGAHKALLRYGVAILEGLRLEFVPPGDYELIALPLKLRGLDGSPVRAILRDLG